MYCKLLMMDELGSVEKEFCKIPIAFLKALSRQAKEYNLSLLAFLNEDENTIFNIQQLREVKQEIKVLKVKCPNLNLNEEQLFENSINQVLEQAEYTYLKIICKNT